MQTTHKQAQHAANRTAKSVSSVDFIQREAGNRLLARLRGIKSPQEQILDLGAGTGSLTSTLSERYPNSTCYALDHAFQRLKQITAQRSVPLCAKAESLPFKSQSLDLIVSNAMLDWCDDLPRLFQEVSRVLQPEGLLLFTCFGPDTLLEFRRAWEEALGPVYVKPFTDMHNLGDLLLACGFRDPVLDKETITVNYRSVDRLLEDIRQQGMHNPHPKRQQHLVTPRQLARVKACYEANRQEGKLPVTVELIQGHAFGSRSANAVSADGNGDVCIPITALR